MTPKISIIVPVYNAEAYLNQCVDSILQQGFDDFELLLVDDGSPDNSPAICDEYAEKDNRVKVLHKPNGGVSSARNAALDIAVGEFVVFIDSDDYVDKNYLSGMLDAEKRNRAEGKSTLIITDYQPFSEKGLEKRSFPEPFCIDCDSASAQSFRDLVFEFRVFPPYCKLYRLDVIKAAGLRFDTEIKSAEDFDFNMRYIEKTDRICYEPSTAYHYRVGYKRYRPSNHGVLGHSEIKSMHIMANGFESFAKRMGAYDELYDEICIWAAKKHYFNRLRMLFAVSPEVSTSERRKLYKQLISDKVYRRLHKRGITLMDKSTTQIIGSTLDTFDSWLLFYKAVQSKNKPHGN